MARRGRSKARSTTPEQVQRSATRDAPDVTRDFLDLRSPAVLPRSGLPLVAVEDRRLWRPSDRHPVTPRQKATVTASPATRRSQGAARGLPEYLRFKAPTFVVACIRRKQRREVLHALRKTGRGPRRAARWSALSRVRCR